LLDYLKTRFGLHLNRLRRSRDGAVASGEKSFERLAELTTHPAVDEEVDRVAEEDEEVDEERRQATLFRFHDKTVEGVFVDEGDHEDSQRELDEQEHPYDGHKHQRCQVALGQASALRLAIQPQQLVVSLLGGAHRMEEKSVEGDEDDAGNEMDEDDPEPPVGAEDQR